MNRILTFKIIGFGVLNFLGRFIVGGILYKGIVGGVSKGVQLDPTGFTYGAALTVAAFVFTYLLMKFVIKPASINEAFMVAILWTIISLILDVLAAAPIYGIPATYLLGEVATWTRLLVIFAAVPFVVRKSGQEQV